MTEHPVGHDRRLSNLTDDTETLLGAAMADETAKGYYYVTLRTWPHPDAEDAWTLSIRYAYLTKGNGGDGWTDEGVNMRAYDPERFLKMLAQMFAGSIPRFDGDTSPWIGNVTEE